MPYVDFNQIADLVPVEDVARWLGLELVRKGDQWRTACPTHGTDRSLVITPEKKRFWCFSPQCNEGGDCIQLVVKVRQITHREAALALQKHFLAPAKQTSEDSFRKVADYLDPTHPLVEELGVSVADARAMGIGYAIRGTMVKRVLFPLRTPDGKLVGYIGVNPQLDPPVKLPTRFHL